MITSPNYLKTFVLSACSRQNSNPIPMKTIKHNNRRDFLATTIKSAILLGAGTSIAGGILNPAKAVAQTAEAALQAKIAMLGTASLQTSQLALSKASNAEVKMFAKFEAAEQETMGKILKDMGTMVPAPSAEGKAMLAKLQSLSGAAFDAAFMQGQVDTHIKLKDAVTSLMNATSSKDVKHVTSLALTSIQEHTERGKMLLTKI
jgi:putative membrane protein